MPLPIYKFIIYNEIMPENNRLQIKRSTLKILWANSGGKCAICKDKIVEQKSSGENFPIGKEVHICGVKPSSKRYDQFLDDEQRRNESNLLLLCSVCHDLIDSDDSKYTIDYLKNIK